MNYHESLIQNFESCNAGIPEHLAISALVERYFDGWDGSDIADLPECFDFEATRNWQDLKRSNAWDYTTPEAIRAALIEHVESIAIHGNA